MASVVFLILKTFQFSLCISHNFATSHDTKQKASVFRFFLSNRTGLFVYMLFLLFTRPNKYVDLNVCWFFITYQ